MESSFDNGSVSLLPGRSRMQRTLRNGPGLGCDSVQRVNVDRANTVLYCDEWVATMAFYRDVLGFEVEHETDWFVEFRVAGDAYLSIADTRRTTIVAVGGKGV